MIVPLIITSAGMFFFYARYNLVYTFTGIIMAHVALATPFVVITVTATLIGFDMNMVKASQSLGANPTRTFFKVIMPLILPGVISGALFAFITSFDEIVIVMFMASLDQVTIPRQMWSGIRQEISPVILCMATCLVVLSIFPIKHSRITSSTIRKITRNKTPLVFCEKYRCCGRGHCWNMYCFFFTKIWLTKLHY